MITIKAIVNRHHQGKVRRYLGKAELNKHKVFIVSGGWAVKRTAVSERDGEDINTLTQILVRVQERRDFFFH